MSTGSSSRNIYASTIGAKTDRLPAVIIITLIHLQTLLTTYIFIYEVIDQISTALVNDMPCKMSDRYLTSSRKMSFFIIIPFKVIK